MGIFTGDCLFVADTARGPVMECDITLSLVDGKITMEGPLLLRSNSDVGPTTFAVTGGTNRFRTARGEVNVVYDPEGRDISLQFVPLGLRWN